MRNCTLTRADYQIFYELRLHIGKTIKDKELGEWKNRQAPVRSSCYPIIREPIVRRMMALLTTTLMILFQACLPAKQGSVVLIYFKRRSKAV